ncbi:UDP-N-acetylmuramate dehydrogenase [Candidatus Kaiserbacteria bacterium]|nr:UDP-N-acetylmuramate dehydrogenase [Candidatus Kaiserbacteria bacterium]
MQKVKENVLLASLTTFEIGGPAKYLLSVRTEADIREALAWAADNKLRVVILGGGSNVLIPDEGIDALVVRLRGDLYACNNGAVDSWAGTNLLSAMRALGAQGWGGWEKLAGIPGTIGGAVRGNAGAFGPEIKDFVTNVRALNSETGEIKDFVNQECDFSYRHSFFKDHPEWIITRVFIRLEKVDPTVSAKLADETIAERERRHLQNVRAAGSYFMNPTAPAEIVAMFEREKQTKSREGRVPAGWLIEKAGMKGATVGGAIASLQHPNYLVNQRNATAENVRQLAEEVKEAVKSQFGVELHEEAAVL